MKRGRPRKFFKNLTFARIIPNIATLAALFVGLLQVKFALVSKWNLAVLAVVGASILDAMDGRIARMLGSISRFGAELDSLSDFAVFGICPAFVMYLYSLSSLGRLGWIICVFFASCMCLRLARFNTNDIENIKTPVSGKFFIGVPAPAGAILGLFPITAFNAFGLKIFRNPCLCSIIFAVFGGLLISRVPTFSIKKLHIKKEIYKSFLVCGVVVAGLLFIYTWKAFVIICLLYAGSIMFSYNKAKKIAKQNDTFNISQ